MFAFRLKQLAEQLGATLYGDGELIITGVASMKSAKQGQITFLSDKKFENN